ncbi:MAG: isopeptide-forming domain-containing fimbrial protein [Pseudomonadota bacterium]
MTSVPKFELLEDRIVLDGADPEVMITGPDGGIQLGEQDVGFTLTFDNVGPETGYVPYAELIIPTSGGDGEGDGPTFDSASFLGTAIPTTVLTFDTNGEVQHPFLTNPDGSALIVTGGQEGDTLVVFELPYGSFSPGNPAVDIDVVIDFSDQADLGSLPEFQALGGFALGCDPLDNPLVDAPIRGTADTLQVDPQLLEVSKVNNGPEEEGATGPSYIYTYDLIVEVAPGQSIDNFTLTDNLPPEIVYLGNVNISGGSGGTVTTEPTVGNQVQPGEQFIVDFSEVSGTVVVSFDYFISNDPSDSPDPTNDPVTGLPTPVENEVTGSGTWTPADPDDAPIVVSDNAMNIIEASSIAIQKSNLLLPANDVNAPGPSPGDTYVFTLDIQVSDFFTFGDLVVQDILGDGWDYIDGSATFVSDEEVGAITTSTSLTGVETVVTNTPGAGETTITWDLSQALINAGSDGLLTGDIAGDGSSSGSNTTVTITYEAIILSDFANPGSGDTAIGQGDALSNAATVTGDVRANLSDGGDPTIATGNTVSDDGASEVVIPRGAIESKTVFALNGNTSPPADVVIGAGDTVTFSIVYRAPLAIFEDFQIVDNLPQLVFDSASEFAPATTWIANPVDDTAPPPAGQAYFGSGTSDFFTSQIPTISTDGPNNGLIFEFGDFTGTAAPEEVTIEILFTATVEDAIFAPELFLTNQATAFESNTAGVPVDSTAIAQFTYGEPVLNISKGVVATDANDPEVAITGPIGLSGVTVPDTSVPRFSGTVTSQGLNVDANIENIDSGDTVTFAIVLENEGIAPNGAFNVTVTDTIPTGFEIPSSGLNLSITDGTGAPIGFTQPDGSAAVPADLFTTGLLLNDDGPLEGALSAFNNTSGENIVVVTYDLVVNNDADPSVPLVNTAAITSFNAFEGNGMPFDPVDGPVNRVVDPIEDTAQATVEEIEISKTFDTSSRQFNSEISGRGGREVAIGEEFEFVVRVDLPEGEFLNFEISDAVTNGGLTLISAQIETFGAEPASMTPNIVSSTGLGVGDSVAAVGNAWLFDFGTLENTSDNDSTNDFIEIRVFARAGDDEVGNANHFMRNVAEVSFQTPGGDTVTDRNGANIRLIEPNVQLDKSAAPAIVDAGGTVNYIVDITNPATFRDAPAFDLTLSDTLDPNVVLDTSSIMVLLNGAVQAFDGTNFALTTNVGGNANAFEVFIDQLDQNDVVEVSYDATVLPNVQAGLTIPNTADLIFDSTPEDDSAMDGDDREFSLTDDAEVITRAPGVDKSVVPGSTTYDETTGNDLGIGELVTYELVLTIPEGSVEDVVVTDTLPDGLEYVSSEVIRIGDVTTPGATGPAENIDGSLLAVGDMGVNVGQVTTFTFGDLTNPPDPVMPVQDSRDEIVVQITARLTDDPINVSDGVDLTNTGALSFTDGGGMTQTVEDTETVTVVEPNVDIAKTVTPATADAGDTVTYEVRATNNGNGPAFDMIINDDVVGPEVSAIGVATITILDAGGGVFTPTEAPTFTFDGVTGALEVIVPELPAGHEVVIEYDAVVQEGVLFSSTFTNTASVARYDSNPEGDAFTPPADPDEEERVFTGPSDMAEFATPDVTLDKAFFSSGDPNTTDPTGGNNAELNIGEEVVYELTITVPEGTADIVLTDDLPPGLLAQSAEVISIGTVGDTSANIAAGDTDASSASITINGSRDQVSFDFGTINIVGSDDAAATNTQIVVRVTSIVEDLAGLASGDMLTNTATVSVSDPVGGGPLQADVTASETVDIVEPELDIDKTGPVGADPGDIVDYVITVTNSGDGPAYDAAITDPLADPNLTYQTGSAQVFLNGALLAPQPSIVEPAPSETDGFSITGLTLLPGDVVTVEFEVELNAAAPNAQSFLNTATVEFDSFDGDGTDADGSPLGRDGSDSDDHIIATVPFIEKTPVGSQLTETDSLLGSTPFALAIGEEVTYSYDITLPEIDLASVIVTDLLPTGLEFVSVSVTDVNGTGASGLVTTTPDVGNPNLITFDFGGMNNAFDGSIGPDDVLEVEIVARVVDLGSVNAGDTLTNTASLDVTPVGMGAFDTQVATADVFIVEPSLSIDKTGPLALDPGGPAEAFRIEVTNDGVLGAEGPAYDLDITDTLPAGMTLDTGSLSFATAGGGPLIPGSLVATAGGFTAEFDVLLPSETIVITYNASLDAGASPLTTFENTASADYFSAPEGLLDQSGGQAARDYAPVEDTHTVSTLPTITKEAIGSGTPETPDDADSDMIQDLAIGETVTYALTLTLPEIPLDTLILTDMLPTGLSFVLAEIDGIGSEITVGGSTDLMAINAAASIVNVGQDLTITLTDVDNAFVDGVINTAQDAIVVEIIARVEDIPANVAGGTLLTNTAGLTITPQGEAALTEVTDTESVEIVEPNLVVDKASSIAVNPGDQVDYTVTIENDGTAPAFDVIVADTLADANLTLVPGSVTLTLAGVDITSSVTVTENAGGFSFELDNNATGDPFPLLVGPANALVVDYSAILDVNAPDAQTFLNTVNVDYDGLPGDPLDENGNPVDDRDYTATDDASVATVPFLTKTPTTSNFAETDSEIGDNPFDLNIGEEVTFTFELFLPEIPLDSVVLEETLPPGLEFVRIENVMFGAGLTDLSGGALTAPTPIQFSAQNFLLDFGGILNPEDTSPPTIGPDDVITVEITARVTNDGVPDAGDILTNNATLEVVPVGGAPFNTVDASADVRVVEPELEIDKTGPLAVAPGGDGAFVITIENSGPNLVPPATGPAYDVEVVDTLPADFTLDASSISITLNGLPFTPGAGDLTTTATSFALDVDVLEADDVLVISYDATLAASAPPLTSFTNTATANYDSAPGPSNDPFEETYAPVSDDHTIISGPAIEKTAIDTGFTETAEDDDSDGLTDLQIGETVTYEIEVLLPEFDLDSLEFTDLLPTGLQFVSAEVSEIGSAITVGGSTDLTAINAGASFVEMGQMLSVTLADVDNADSDGAGTRANDGIVLQVTALVENIPANADGSTLTNTGGVIIDPEGPDGPLDEVTDTETIEIVEPALDIEKSGAVAGNPGDSVPYSITINNTGTGTAFDALISDPFTEPLLTFDTGSVQVFLNGALLAPQPTVTTPITGGTDGFELVVPVITQGDEIRVEFTATIDPTAPTTTFFSNTASVEYDSAPGDPVDGMGIPLGRDYAPETDDHQVSTGGTIEKTATASEFVETPEDADMDGLQDLAIGEEVTYQLVVTLPDIDMDSVVVTDLLPTGLRFVEARVVTIGSDITVNGSTDIVNVGATTTVTFNDVENMLTMTPTGVNDQIVVEIDAVVTNIPSNTDGIQLTNTGGLIIDPAGPDGPLAPVTDTETVELIEPDVSVQKTAGVQPLFPGATVVYSVVVTNDANATSPAFNTIVTDNLPTGLTLTGVVSLSDPMLGSVSATSIAGSTALIVNVPILQPGQSLTIDYEALVGSTADLTFGVTNTADIATDSTPDPMNPDGRTTMDQDSATISPVFDVVVDDPPRVSRAIEGIDDALFLPVLQIDPIFTGTAEPGSNVTIKLFTQDGRLDYVRNILADSGGHWIAIFPRVQLEPLDEQFFELLEGSVLFDQPVELLDQVPVGEFSFAPELIDLEIQSNLQDEAFTIDVSVDRPSTLPQDQSIFNTRLFFFPGNLGEIYSTNDTLNVDEVFQNIAFRSVQELYEASADPLGTSLNRFNYEFISTQTAAPGQ